MQKKVLLTSYVLVLVSFFIFNLGCNGSKISQADFSSLSNIPVTGKCGSQVNACETGVLLDVNDDTSFYKWSCLGVRGGADASCEIALNSAPPGASTGVGDKTTTLYVGISSGSNMVAHVHAASDFNTPCVISADTTANTDLSCIIEVPEAELMYKNLSLEYNVPNGMCGYLERRAPWFYNYEVGVGPTAISVDITTTYNASGVQSGDVTTACLISSDQSIATSATCDFSGNPAVEAKLDGFTPSSANFKCLYDHTSAGSNMLPNCCIGNYTLRINQITDNDGTISSNVTTTTRSWGNISKCIGGAGSSLPRSTSGYPVSFVDLIDGKALNAIFDFPPTINYLADRVIYSDRPVNAHFANYFGDAANHSHGSFVSGLTSLAPYFYDPLDDRDGTLISPGQLSYEFRCLSRAYEIKHRIRVYVRDWDTYPDFLAYVESSGATFNPDRSGNDGGASCEGLPLPYPCNDMRDLDDFLNLTLILPSYDTSGPITDRALYFPKVPYQ